MPEHSGTKKVDYLLSLALEAQLSEDEETNLYKSDSEMTELHSFSTDHKTKMRQIFSLAEKKDRSNRRKLRLVRTAAGIGIIFFISAATIANVEAFRVPFINFFTEIKEKSSILGVDTELKYSLTKVLVEYEPTYVPDGFSVDFIKETHDMYIIQYINDDIGKWYCVNFKKNASSVAIDTEGGSTETMEREGRTYTVIKKGEGDIKVVMYKDGHQYQVSGNIEYQIIMEILESIY